MSEQLPAAARRFLTNADSELIYNPYATATWRTVQTSGRVLYLKAAWVGCFPSLADERDRCLWLSDRAVPVPEVVDHGSDGEVEWLVSVALSGTPATAADHVRDPRRLVSALAEGLRAFHSVDPAGCPFDYGVAHAVAHVRARVASGVVDAAGFHEVHQHLTAEQAFARLRELAPEQEQEVVVCHGDYCLPNVLLVDDRVVGYVDLGEVGLAERWRDLAVATWSVTWNLGPGLEGLFLDAYGANWDLERRDFYRLLYDLEA